MTVPDYQSLMAPVLHALADGQERSISELHTVIAEQLALTLPGPAGSRSACHRMTWRKLTATMTATTATSRDHRRAPATIRALVMPQGLVNRHT